MTEFNEQEERTKDQPYLDGFNMGYQIQKQLESKSLSKKDKETLESLSKVIRKSKSEDDKLQGMKDGRQQRIYELEKEKNKDRFIDRDK